jgi:hypothetical protein
MTLAARNIPLRAGLETLFSAVTNEVIFGNVLHGQFEELTK